MTCSALPFASDQTLPSSRNLKTRTPSYVAGALIGTVPLEFVFDLQTLRWQLMAQKLPMPDYINIQTVHGSIEADDL